MGAATERLALIVTADASGAVRAIGDVGTASGRLADTQPRLSRVGQTLTRTLTPAALGFAAAGAVMFQKFDEGADALRAAGATGDGFVESMKRVGNNVPASLGEVGTAMGELYQRTQLTGEPLEELTQQVLELREVGQNVNVEQLTASMAKSGVAAEDMADALDTMFRVAQITGTSVEKLSQLQEQFGAALDLTGLSMEDQLLLLGQFEKSGVNTSSVMAGMTRGLRDFAAAGKDPASALNDTIEAMKNAATEAEAVAIGNEVFGRSAVEVSAAIRNGTLDLEAMQAALAGNTDSIHDAAEGTRDWQEKLAMAQNKLVGILGPLGQYGMALGGIAAGAGPVLSGLGKMSGALQTAGGAMTVASRVATFTADNIGNIAGGAAVATASLALLAYGMNENARAAESQTRAVNSLSDALRDAESSMTVASDAVTEVINNNDFLRDAMNETGVSVAEVAAALDAGGSSWDAMRSRLAGADSAGRDAGMQLDLLAEVFGRSKVAVDESSEALANNSDATGNAAGKQRDMERATKDVNDVLQAEIEKLNELYDTINTSIDAAYAYEESQYSSLEAVQAMIDIQTDASASATDVGRATNDAEQAILDQSRAAVELAAKMAESNGVQLTAADKARLQRDELIRLKAQFPELAAQIDGFIAALNRIPATKQVDIKVSGGNGFLPEKSIPSGAIGMRVPGGRGRPFPMVAHGGEQVLNADDANEWRRGQGRGGGSQTIVTNVWLDGEMISRSTEEHTRKHSEAQYGIPVGVS